ncbi:MAG TPA: DUF4190 domain-containing protein [Acidimicrobiales bacterium]|nr:DUF4190 domain-containing protein [Acidimicrobiales bacterium]
MSTHEGTKPLGGPVEPCVNCGTPIPPEANACPSCGVRRIPLGPSGPPMAPPVAPMGTAPSGPPPYPGYATPGAYAQPGYPPPGYGGAPYAAQGYPQQTNNKATTSLVLGIIGLVVCQIVSIFAIVIGNQAAREIRYSGGTQTGEGMATAGRILGWIGVAIMVVVIVLIVAITMLGTTTPN